MKRPWFVGPRQPRSFWPTILSMGVCLLLAAAPIRAYDLSWPWGTPRGFYQLQDDVGVVLYRKDYADKPPDFVQVIDLGQGARIKALHGLITDPGTGQGTYGGDNPKITRQPLERFWHSFSYVDEAAFCVTNGQFFSSTLEAATALTFPLRKDGRVISEGYGYDRYPDGQRVLKLWDDRADIARLSQYAVYWSTAPTVLGSLANDAGSNPSQVTGRTFVGLRDDDGNLHYEVVLIFTSQAASQLHATEVLESFGAEKVIMFDGGGSTQLLCQDRAYVVSGRDIPQAFAVASGAPPRLNYDAQVIDQVHFTTMEPYDMVTLHIELRNTGIWTWAAEQPVELVLVKNDGFKVKSPLSLPQAIETDETVRWEFTAAAPGDPGLYTMIWELRNRTLTIGEPITVSVVVLER